MRLRWESDSSCEDDDDDDHDDGTMREVVCLCFMCGVCVLLTQKEKYYYFPPWTPAMHLSLPYSCCSSCTFLRLPLFSLSIYLSTSLHTTEKIDLCNKYILCAQQQRNFVKQGKLKKKNCNSNNNKNSF